MKIPRNTKYALKLFQAQTGYSDELGDLFLKWAQNPDQLVKALSTWPKDERVAIFEFVGNILTGKTKLVRKMRTIEYWNRESRDKLRIIEKAVDAKIMNEGRKGDKHYKARLMERRAIRKGISPEDLEKYLKLPKTQRKSPYDEVVKAERKKL